MIGWKIKKQIKLNEIDTVIEHKNEIIKKKNAIVNINKQKLKFNTYPCTQLY